MPRLLPSTKHYPSELYLEPFMTDNLGASLEYTRYDPNSSVLLDPLLTKGADEVVFDTLSYSAGPLPEQQLSSPDFPSDVPVWVVYGKDDPWTPPGRVENLEKFGPGSEYGVGPVERVVALDGAGHCPHDERPDAVNRLILEFLDRLRSDA